MAGRTDQPLRHRKARDRAVILPLVGAMLFLPPVATIFRVDASHAGIPLPVLYLFAVWAGLILCAALLAPRLRDSDAAVDEPAATGAAVGPLPRGELGGTAADPP